MWQKFAEYSVVEYAAMKVLKVPGSYHASILLKRNMSVCLFICMLPMAGRTAGPIKTKLGTGTHVDPGSVLVKVKVKVIYRGPQGQDNRSSAKRDKYGGQRHTRAERIEARRAAETTPPGGRVLTASTLLNGIVL